MKAVMKTREGVGNVELCEIEEPKVGPRDVKIEVQAVGICGTDIKIRSGDAWSNLPVVLGHELSGIIAEVGSEVTDLKVGQRVVTETGAVVCGHCYYCKTGNFLMCRDRLSIGYGVDGGMTQFCVVPEDIIHTLPDDVSFEAGSLCEPAAVAVHAVYDSVRPEPGDLVVVIGAGAIGLLVAQIAKDFGATVIITGLTHDRLRLDKAKQLGIDYAVDTQTEDLEALVMELSENMGADLVYECSGSAPGVRTGMSMLKKMGSLVQIGLTKPTLEIEYSMLTGKQIRLVGTFGHKWKSWEIALHLIQTGKLNTQALITHTFPLSEWEEAFRIAEAQEGIKVVLLPNA